MAIWQPCSRRTRQIDSTTCPLEPTDLRLEFLDLSQFLLGGALALSTVDLGLNHPAAHRLLADALTSRDGLRRGRKRRVTTAGAPAPAARTAP